MKKVELIAINFVLEFARDLQKLLEKIEKEFGQLLVVGSAYYKKKIQERASELTEELYEKYKQVLDLKLEQGDEGINIVLKNYDNEEYLLPKEFFKGSKFYELKENFNLSVYTIEKGSPVWDDFSFRLIQLLISNKSASFKVNYRNLEKIRFFMNFININSYFDYETVPKMYDKLIYHSRYEKWGRYRTYSNIFNKFIKSDIQFFRKRVNLFPIPNYPTWNLQLSYFNFDRDNELNECHLHNYYPIQIIEDKKGIIKSIIGLETNQNELGDKIEEFSIINNFEIFQEKIKKTGKIKPKFDSIFESYVKFLDEINNENQISYFLKSTNNIHLNFKSPNRNPEYLIKYLKKKTIQEFNMLYDRQRSKFVESFLSDTNQSKPTLRFLFKSTFAFPGFNSFGNYFLIIRKKRKNSEFDRLVLFLKNWCFQTSVYELKNQFIFNGFLPPNFNFNYSKEAMYLQEILDSLNVEYSFVVSSRDYVSSNLSLYSLPISKFYQEERNTWNLPTVKFRMSVKEKEQFILSQNKEESFNSKNDSKF